MRYGFLDLSGVEQKLTQLILRIAVTGMRGDDGRKSPMPILKEFPLTPRHIFV
jgi:hypothetical protein